MRLFFVTLLCATVLAASTSADEIRYFRIGTGGTAGTYFPVGTLIAKGLSGAGIGQTCAPGEECGVPGLLAVAQTSNGSVSNVKAIADGELEAGLAQADVVDWAYRGIEIFTGQGRIERLRAVATLYPESLQVVARRDAGIETMGDLRGKRISLDEPGSGTLVDARIVLHAYALSESDLDPEYIKPDLALDKMLKNEIDGFFIVAGFPTASVVEAASALDIRLVPIGEPRASEIQDATGFLIKGTIPVGTYRGVPATATLQVAAQLVVDRDLDEALIYRITKALWSERTRQLLHTGHPKGSSIRLDAALRGVTIPLHPGAARYYREIGLLNRSPH